MERYKIYIFALPFRFCSGVTNLTRFFSNEFYSLRHMDIKIHNLSKSYGFQKAVNDISFEVHTGEILGFLGPNGAGKTTTMKMITGYIDADQGEILIGGRSIHSSDLRRHIGYLPEHNPLYQDMPVIDYLEFCAALQGVARDRIPERVREMVRVCGLDVEKHKRIRELSKGYRQRVGLAQAMIHDPEILILDEPTTGLDPNQIVEIRELIKKLGKEKTVILSTHILPEVEATCDRILIINQGRIVADGASETLRKQAQGQQVLHVRIEAGPPDEILAQLRALSGVALVDFLSRDESRFEIQSKPDVSSNREIFDLCVKNKWALTEMIPFETRLEDVFRNLTMN
jgi:ABC-2 type transport system ATP-binding protein